MSIIQNDTRHMFNYLLAFAASFCVAQKLVSLFCTEKRSSLGERKNKNNDDTIDVELKLESGLKRNDVQLYN